MKISVIIPTYNEEKTIDKLLDKIISLKNLNLEIIVVDDGSNDKTQELLEKYNKYNFIFLYKHSKNLGKGAAIKTAKNKINGDIIIIQDADLEYDPGDYKNLINPIISGKYKVVYGSRVLGKKRYYNKSFTSKFRVFANHLLTILSNLINSQKLTDAHTCYKVFHKTVFNKIQLKENGFSFCPEITTKISNENFEIYEVPISYKGREYKDGKKIKISDGLKAIISLVRYKIEKFI